MISELAARAASYTPPRTDGVKDVDIATVVAVIKAAFAVYECFRADPARAAAKCGLPLAVRVGVRRAYQRAGVAPGGHRDRMTTGLIKLGREITEDEIRRALAESENTNK